MEAVAQRIGALTERLIDHVRVHEPVEATRLGMTERDTDLPDLSLPALEARQRSLSELETAVRLELGALTGPRDGPRDGPRTGMVRELAGDLDLLLDAVRWRQVELSERPALAVDPAVAMGIATGGVLDLLRDLGPDPELGPEERRRRVDAAVSRARAVPWPRN